MEESEYSFTNKYCSCKIYSNRNSVKVIGQLTDTVKDGVLNYLAAAPADHITSYTGSGLAFPNEEVAFDNTPNKGKMKINASKFLMLIGSRFALFIFKVGICIML